jgi:hypothetical protein
MSVGVTVHKAKKWERKMNSPCQNLKQAEGKSMVLNCNLKN